MNLGDVMRHFSFAFLLLISMAANSAPPAHYSYRNWVIDNASVCNNYKYGSVLYRDCRSGAREYFIKRCDELKQRVENLGMSAPDVTRHEKDMFCHAASTFSPVN